MAKPVVSLIAPDDFVARIHASGVKMVLAATGGGSQAISALLSVPGGSQSVLAAVVPYSSAALVEFLRARPEHFCTEHTARLMAMAAYEQAQRLAAAEDNSGADVSKSIVGVACTASLVSDRPKRGAHRIHVAAQTATLTAVASLELVKGARDRHAEEALAAQVLLNMVARGCGLAERLSLDLSADECVVEDGTVAPREWQALFAGEVDRVPVDAETSEVQAGGHAARQQPQPKIVFPGAFHPLHAGHLAMADVAQQRLGAAVDWEISITNVDKPPLDFHEMRLRAEQFRLDDGSPPMPLWFTRAPTFVAKASIFPGATFLVGADTIERIAQPRYYGNDATACQAALEAIATAGCRFLVFGRKVQDRFESLADLQLPPVLANICVAVPESEFRADVSSTELRRATSGDD